MVVLQTHHHHRSYENEAKMNDIFEQTVIVDKPLSKHFYDHLKEVTIDAEIVVGRKGIVEEIVPLEQWESVISEAIAEIPEEEDWVIEPEEVLYTVVKWEGIEGGEKHIVENRQWKEVAHTPPIHTKHHVSPMVDDMEGQNYNSKFTFENHEIHDGKHETHNVSQNGNKSEMTFEKPHASATTETTWHSTTYTQKIDATHQSSVFSNGTRVTEQNDEAIGNGTRFNEQNSEALGNGTIVTAQNDEPLGSWHKVQSPVEKETINSQSEEHRTFWHKTHVSQPERPHNFQHHETPIPATRIPKPRTSYSNPNSPESPKATTKVVLKSNGTTVFRSGFSPQPSPPPNQHQFIAAKPASHSTFMRTSYVSNSPTSSPEQLKSPPGTREKVTWRRTHGNQYVRETVPVNSTTK